MTRGENETLNPIVSACLDFAELRARNRKPMATRDWNAKLDDFLKPSDRELLTHSGAISRDQALAKAETEYDKFRAIEDLKPRPVAAHLEETIQRMKRISAARARHKPQRDRRWGPE